MIKPGIDEEISIIVVHAARRKYFGMYWRGIARGIIYRADAAVTDNAFEVDVRRNGVAFARRTVFITYCAYFASLYLKGLMINKYSISSSVSTGRHACFHEPSAIDTL